MVAYESNPERDKFLASKTKYGARKANQLSDLVSDWTKTTDYKRMMKMSKVQAIIKALLGAVSEKITPISFYKKALVLECEDNMIMTELKSYHHRKLLQILVEKNIGCTDIKYRLKKTGKKK